jgi:DNA-binding transcriptional LysR family regulator
MLGEERNMDWNDVQIFLALIRAGSVRGAGKKLAISHATVARRIEAFEKRLGVSLFNRLNTGYELTKAGEDLIGAAENVESELHSIQRKLVGQDKKLAGTIRVTTTELVASHFLIPELSSFMAMYPHTKVEMIETYLTLDLSRREADIALRIGKKPPENLIARSLAAISIAEYASKSYVESHDLEDPMSASLISRLGMESGPIDYNNTQFKKLPIRGSFSTFRLQMEAAKHDVGIATLPCFVAEKEVNLVIVSDKRLVEGYQIWLLRHPDTRATSRLRVFSEFIVESINKHKYELESID